MRSFDLPRISLTFQQGPAISRSIGLYRFLFNGWLYRAELHQYVAQYNADLSNYRQVTLVAFQQVEDFLVATRVYSQQILRQQEAVKASQDYLSLELDRYNIGVDPYVDVVIAQNTLLSDQETLNALEVEEMTSTVQLVQALGGGWDRSQLPTPDQAGAKTSNADYSLQQ